MEAYRVNEIAAAFALHTIQTSAVTRDDFVRQAGRAGCPADEAGKTYDDLIALRRSRMRPNQFACCRWYVMGRLPGSREVPGLCRPLNSLNFLGATVVPNDLIAAFQAIDDESCVAYG